MVFITMDQNNNYNAYNSYDNSGDQSYVDHYDDASGQGNSYSNYYSDPSSGQNGKKPSGGKVFLKVLAGLAALAIVSVSSIEMYKLFGKETARDWSSSAESEAAIPQTTDEDAEVGATEAATNAAVSNAASWISLAAPKDALTIPEIVNKALPSVVGISANFEFEPQTSSYWGFNFYGGFSDGGSGKQTMTGTGTGIVMSENGYIITNAHCIYDDSSEYKAGKAVSVSVVMGDDNETEYDAEIVGYDLQTDLAVLKIDATGLTPAEFGDSDQLSVGELVVAIGNPLGFELFGTTTCGIVSALNRDVTINEKDMTLIQTDAAINHGNSGGPLLNAYGQVVGINSAKMGSTYGSDSVEGLGFAIPISDAKSIIDDLINNGYVTGRPQLGISGVNVTEADAERFNLPQGVYVYSVVEGGAADLAGLREHDVITAIDGQEITTMNELTEIKDQHNAGDTISLTIYRSGETLDVQLTLQEKRQEQ